MGLIYEQKNLITDFIFPLVTIKEGSTDFKEMIGTAFFIGNKGFALTASHVIDQLLESGKTLSNMTAIFPGESNWAGILIEAYEQHPSEDVAIIKLYGESWKSILSISNQKHHASTEYVCWGYPYESSKDLQHVEETQNSVQPNIVYTQGYIRRRISNELPYSIFKGKNWFELSEIVGGGNSGGPIIHKDTFNQEFHKMQVIGIYSGEKNNIGFGVRAESFFDWQPKILNGRNVGDESILMK